MATKAGFKQQCPHCEARVPIKDEKLIGEEIKCPKCKQPFVVEDLADSDGGEAPPAPAGKAKKDRSGPKGVFKDEDEGVALKEAKKPKKEKKRLDLKATKLILVGGLTAVALVFLAVAFFLMRGGENKPAGPAVAAGGAPAPAPKKKAEPAPAKPATAEAPPPPTSTGNPTNLLPGDTEIVLDVQMQEMLKNTLGRMVFEPEGGARPASFEARYGFPIESVERWIAAGRYSMEWVFEVIRTNKAIPQASVRKALKLKPADAPIQGQEYFVTTYNWLEAGSPVRYLMRGEPPAAAPGSRPLAVRFPDSTTMVFGDLAPIEEFLKLKQQFPRQPNPPGAPAGSGSYTTISPKLRAVLDRVQSKPPVLFAFALSLDADTRPNLDLGSIPLTDTASAAAISAKVKEKIELIASFECRNEDYAKTLWGSLSSLLRQTEAAAKAAGVDFKLTETKPKERGGQGDEEVTRGGARMAGRRGGGGGPAPAPVASAKVEKKASAKLSLSAKDRAVELGAELELNQAIYDRLVKIIEPYLIRSQSEIEMTLAHPSTHELGGALQRYAVEHKQFPSGTMRRPLSPARANRPWPPDRRVSWMAEMLPYIGFDGLYAQIKPQRSWQDPENMPPSVTVIPAFLDPANPHSTWYLRYPGMDYDVAATHFVGIAGVGMDAAEYSASNPAVAAKLGVFGYDRYTRLTDLADGLSTTVVVAEVPPTYKAPWIAGGGSTIRGVPEAKSIQPFVSATLDGRRGTVVIMADGSVRFLTENISDEVFKSLCTVKKTGEKIKINKVAPLMPKKAEEPDTKAQVTPADREPK